MCYVRFHRPHMRDKVVIITASVIGCIALLLLCVGLALPTWYVGYSMNPQTITTTANYFYTCHLGDFNASASLTCVSYTSYICDQLIPLGCQNGSVSGCVNPEQSAMFYRNLDAPITYISTDNLNRLRAASALAIIGIILLATCIVLILLILFCHCISVGFLYVPLVLLFISDVFLVTSLVAGSLSIRYYHVGCGLFVTGTMLTFLFTVMGAFAVGRLDAKKRNTIGAPDQALKYKASEEHLPTADDH